jgi:hypothetical protein
MALNKAPALRGVATTGGYKSKAGLSYFFYQFNFSALFLQEQSFPMLLSL